MSVLTQLRDPSHWVNRSTYLLLLTLLAALGTTAIGHGIVGIGYGSLWLTPLWPWMRTLLLICFWAVISLIMLSDEHRQPGGTTMATGIVPTRQTPRMIVRGALWAVALLTPVAVTGMLLGGEFTAVGLRFSPVAALTIVMSSIGEEVLFRSTVLRVLKQRFGSVWAVLVTSMLFSFAHTGNHSASMISSVNTFLIAVAFGTVIALGGSIWVAAACHAAWNVLVALFFGAVSGQDAGVGWIRYIPNDSSKLSPLLMGDAYGVESGLLCTAVITISLLLIRHIVVVDPFVIAARYRVGFGGGRSDVNPITAMESSNVA